MENDFIRRVLFANILRPYNFLVGSQKSDLRTFICLISSKNS